MSKKWKFYLNHCTINHQAPTCNNSRRKSFCLNNYFPACPVGLLVMACWETNCRSSCFSLKHFNHESSTSGHICYWLLKRGDNYTFTQLSMESCKHACSNVCCPDVIYLYDFSMITTIRKGKTSVLCKSVFRIFVPEGLFEHRWTIIFEAASLLLVDKWRIR